MYTRKTKLYRYSFRGFRPKTILLRLQVHSGVVIQLDTRIQVYFLFYMWVCTIIQEIKQFPVEIRPPEHIVQFSAKPSRVRVCRRLENIFVGAIWVQIRPRGFNYDKAHLTFGLLTLDICERKVNTHFCKYWLLQVNLTAYLTPLLASDF